MSLPTPISAAAVLVDFRNDRQFSIVIGKTVTRCHVVGGFADHVAKPGEQRFRGTISKQLEPKRFVFRTNRAQRHRQTVGQTLSGDEFLGIGANCQV